MIAWLACAGLCNMPLPPRPDLFDFPLCKLQTLWAGDAEEREQPVASRWIVPRDNQEIGTGLLHDFR
jgi:hypothetical protein